MNTTITPVYSRDAKKAFVEFFTKEFREQQLGQPGRWFFLGSTAPFLRDPVQVADFKMLVERSDLNNLAGDPVAWRLDFPTGRTATTIWALCSQPTRMRIEDGHRLAVKTALMDWLPRVLHAHEGFFSRPTDATCALFASGTGRGQVPDLHTTALLFNTNYTDRIQRLHLSEKKVAKSQEHLSSAYQVYLGRILSQVIGHVNSSEWTKVPGRLFAPLTEQFLTMYGGQKYFEFGGPFKGEALFQEWRRQGEARGFGPTQAEAVLRNAAIEERRNAAAYWEHMQTAPQEATETPTFKEMTEKWMQHQQQAWKNPSSAQQPPAREAQKPVETHSTHSTQHSQEDGMCHSY